jgi:hypothetical protein
MRELAAAESSPSLSSLLGEAVGGTIIVLWFVLAAWAGVGTQQGHHNYYIN